MTSLGEGRWSRLLLAALALMVWSALAWADPPGRVGRLAQATGTVWVYDQEQGEWTAAGINRPVTTGDRLATDNGARADVQVGSASLRLDGGTELVVDQLDDQRVSLRLERGAAALRLRSPESVNEFELVANDARFLPTRTGQYRVDLRDNVATAQAWSGEMRFQSQDSALLLAPGTRYSFWRQDDRTHYDMAAASGEDAFGAWVLAEDQRQDRAASTRYVSPEMTGALDLDRYGRWDTHPEYGAIWYPTTVVAGWAPYRYGHWAWVAPWGWSWVDDAPWGFAPFHYGRWASWRGRWCWVPGRYVARPVYAPALVGWIGGSHISVGVTAGRSTPPLIGWVPLAPRDPYVPRFNASPRYIRDLNAGHASWQPPPGSPPPWVNRNIPGAVTVVPTQALQERRRVADAVVPRVQPRWTAALPAQQPALPPPPRPDRQDRGDRPDRRVGAPQWPDRAERPDRPDRPQPPGIANRPDRPDRPDSPDRPNRPEHPDRPGIADRPDRPDRPGWPDRPSRPERPDHPDRPDRPGLRGDGSGAPAAGFVPPPPNVGRPGGALAQPGAVRVLPGGQQQVQPPQSPQSPQPPVGRAPLQPREGVPQEPGTVSTRPGAQPSSVAPGAAQTPGAGQPHFPGQTVQTPGGPWSQRPGAAPPPPRAGGAGGRDDDGDDRGGGTLRRSHGYQGGDAVPGGPPRVGRDQLPPQQRGQGGAPAFDNPRPAMPTLPAERAQPEAPRPPVGTEGARHGLGSLRVPQEAPRAAQPVAPPQVVAPQPQVAAPQPQRPHFQQQARPEMPVPQQPAQPRAAPMPPPAVQMAPGGGVPQPGQGGGRHWGGQGRGGDGPGPGDGGGRGPGPGPGGGDGRKPWDR